MTTTDDPTHREAGARGMAASEPLPAEPIHPELRRVAWFMPRRVVGPRSFRAVRWLGALMDKRAADRAVQSGDVEVVDLSLIHI